MHINLQFFGVTPFFCAVPLLYAMCPGPLACHSCCPVTTISWDLYCLPNMNTMEESNWHTTSVMLSMQGIWWINKEYCRFKFFCLYLQQKNSVEWRIRKRFENSRFYGYQIVHVELPVIKKMMLSTNALSLLSVYLSTILSCTFYNGIKIQIQTHILTTQLSDALDHSAMSQ